MDHGVPPNPWGSLPLLRSRGTDFPHLLFGMSFSMACVIILCPPLGWRPAERPAQFESSSVYICHLWFHEPSHLHVLNALCTQPLSSCEQGDG